MLALNNNDHVVSVFKEPGFIIFQVDGIELKLPVDSESIQGIHDKSKNFLTELFSVSGVEEVFAKYGVVADLKKDLVTC